MSHRSRSGVRRACEWERLREQLGKQNVRFTGVPGRLFAWRVDWFGRPVDAVDVPQCVRPLTDRYLCHLMLQGANMLEKRRSSSGVPADAPLHSLDHQFAESFPFLWDHLTQEVWPDGSPRELSTLLLFRQDGVFKVMVKDKNAGECCWLSMQRLSDCWAVVNAALGDAGTEWRADRQPGGNGTAKRGGRR